MNDSWGRRSPVQAAAALLLGLLGWASPAAAIWRFDEVEPRRFDYSDEYFINAYSYRPRLSHRWAWQGAAVGYRVTAGSLASDELYLNQEAIVRLPFSDHLVGQYRFREWEDYDARWLRNEVEVVFQFLRPPWRLPLTETLGWTPVYDGLFLGGMGLLDADKEFADVGLLVGWRGTRFGWRLDAIAPDFFFAGKSKGALKEAEYEREPYTLRGTLGGDLLDGDLGLTAWVEHDLPVHLTNPRGALVDAVRYRQTSAGLSARWRIAHDLRADLELTGETTRKRRRTPDDPLRSDDVAREAARAWLQLELDRAPLWGEGASRKRDTWFLGAHLHLLDEETDSLAPDNDMTIRRGEGYLEVGYVLAIPSPGPQYGFGVRATAWGGFLSMRDVREGIDKHTVTEKLVAKVGIGLEVELREGLAFGFLQFTFRLDEPSFGGGNAQVMMRF